MLSSGDKTLVVGVGNPLRSDDGIGPYVAHLLNEKHIPQVQTLIVQQLNPEMIEYMTNFDPIIIVDANLGKHEMEFKKLNTPACGVSSSHYATPALLASLAQTVYGKTLNVYTCLLKGENFEVGEGFSVSAKTIADRAVDTIENFLRKKQYA